MEISITIAKILGPIFVIIGTGVLINLKTYQKMIDSFIKTPGLLYLGGFMSLLWGLIVIEFHNIWVANWTVLITIFGWLAVLKGVVIIMFPNSMIKLSESFLKSRSSLIMRLIAIIVLGIFIIFAAHYCV